MRHLAAQQPLDLLAYAIVDPCFRVRVRVRVFHQTVYSAPPGSTTTVRFTCILNCPCFRVRVFIVRFIVRHMATQQLLDLVANATACPCFRVTVRVRVRVRV